MPSVVPDLKETVHILVLKALYCQFMYHFKILGTSKWYFTDLERGCKIAAPEG